MLRIGHLGTFPTLSPAAEAIWNGDLAQSADLLGCHLDGPIALDPSVCVLPITLAIIGQRKTVIDWLVDTGADLNAPAEPAFLTAARYGDPDLLRRLVAAGANVDAVTTPGGDAFAHAWYGLDTWRSGRLRQHLTSNFEVIDKLGHRVADHGGPTFRLVAGSRGDIAEQLLRFFVDRGVNLDFQEPDMVYPWGPTAMNVAVRYGTLARVRYLVEAGADVTIADLSGMRPYLVAVERGDKALVTYLAGVEPPELHSEEHGLDLLRNHKAPVGLVDFVKRGERIEAPGSALGWLDLLELPDLFEFQAGRRTVLRLSRTSGDFEHIHLVWDARSQQVSSWDEEHLTLNGLGEWADFSQDPEAALTNVEC